MPVRGIVRLYEGAGWRRGRLLWQRENLVVNSGLTALAALLGGSLSGNNVLIVGFGSGNTAPASTDTALGATPAYYNAVGAATIGPNGGVAAGSVLFNYALGTADYAANPLTIQELGLFGNSGGATFPAALGTADPAWAMSHAYSVGTLVVDSSSNVQRVTTAGTSGSAAPTWNTIIGGTTADGTVTWTCVAHHTAPTPMIAHLVVPSFPYTGGGNYAGTWTVSM